MKIRPLTPLEFSTYRRNIITRFANEKVHSEGVDEGLAQQSAERAWQDAFDDKDRQHVIMQLEEGETTVGIIWYCTRIEWGRQCLWLYDIMIHPEYQREGYGRKAMELLEEEARRRNIFTIGLHVFGQNKAAYTLYNSQGFRPTSIVMRKDLE